MVRPNSIGYANEKNLMFFLRWLCVALGKLPQKEIRPDGMKKYVPFKYNMI